MHINKPTNEPINMARVIMALTSECGSRGDQVPAEITFRHTRDSGRKAEVLSTLPYPIHNSNSQTLHLILRLFWRCPLAVLHIVVNKYSALKLSSICMEEMRIQMRIQMGFLAFLMSLRWPNSNSYSISNSFCNSRTLTLTNPNKLWSYTNYYMYPNH